MGEVLENQSVAKKPKHLLRRFYQRFEGVFGPLAIVALIALVSVLVRELMMESSFFGLQKIEVMGDLKMTDRLQIAAVSQVKMGNNLFQISLSEVEKKILSLPWVRLVSVRRQVPGTLQVYVEEQKPIAVLLASGLHFVSEEGVVFKKVEMEKLRDLPVITGFASPENFSDALTLLKFLRKFRDFELFGLSEIHYNETTGFSVVTLEGPTEIKLGKENFEMKIQRLNKIWGTLQTRFGRVRGLDLNYEDRAFVKL